MKRICQVVQHLRPGGIETLVLELARLARDQDTRILSLEGRVDDAVVAWPRLGAWQERIESLDKPPGLRPGALGALISQLRRLRPRAVHTHHVGPLIYGGLAARFCGVPRVVHTEHDAWHLQDPRRLRLQRAILTLVRPRLVADSRQVAESLAHFLPRFPARVIPNGIDTQVFTPGDRGEARALLDLGDFLPDGARLIGCGARLHPVKGHRYLLEALALLPPDVHLALAGDGEEETRLRQQADSLGLTSRVRFIGRIDDMLAFYRALDLFCLPSLKEGMPLSPLEAQACGIPVVVTDVGGSREAVCPQTGTLVPAEDPAALAQGLRQALSRLGAGDARGFVLEHGDARAMVAAYGALYD